MRVKRRKPIYLAYQWGEDDVEVIQRGICTYVHAELDPDGFGGTATLSVWKQKIKGWKDTTVEKSDWIVVRNDGKIWVMDNSTYHQKYMEDTK